MKRNVLVFGLLTMMLLAACGGQSGTLTVHDAWARPAEQGQNSAVYFVIENPAAADTLQGVSSDVAEAVEMHRSVMADDGTMRMEHQMSVPVPAKGSLEFKPGGYHVMLINLKQPLAVGDTFQVVLHLQNAGDIPVEVTVHQP
ncbi:MAG: copper chaperone PCu(A)C [Anaerolineae bacterium]|nr:MAG: copper chaperone PCu(A)C [Anaerolineae bacterium]